jgi:hypothetical protein
MKMCFVGASSFEVGISMASQPGGLGCRKD